MINPLIEILNKRKQGIQCGIPSFCCANKTVIEAILEQANRVDDMVVIEATSNQVNQEDGYMGMKPKDFAEYVYFIADKINFPHEKIILGGDHMGPLPWLHLPAEEAMEKAKELVSLCVKAGYKKIHIDTSMHLGNDDKSKKLPDDVIAERGVVLYLECLKTYQEILKENPEEMSPVFIMGSEVPTPGGNQGDLEKLKVTNERDFENTLFTYQQKFKKYNITNAWDNIIGFVVQPGIEFANDHVHHYERYAAKKLCNCLIKYPDIVFEGHSTDYQSPKNLKKMVEDGIAIIKVGPALTFAYREAIFSLARMEKELLPDDKCSHFIETLENVMLSDNKYWENYYAGNEREQRIQRYYSFYDRSRYYMSMPIVDNARKILFSNLDAIGIPLPMLHQFMPVQYVKVRDGLLDIKSQDLVKDHIIEVVDDYYYAVKYNYISKYSVWR